MPSEDALMTVRQVADLARVVPSTVRRWVAAGHIAAVRNPGPRGAIRFRRAEVERFIAAFSEPTEAAS